MNRMSSDELPGLLWAAQYATKIYISCNKVLGRLIGACSCSPEQIWIQCICTGCQTREPVGYARGGSILSLTEFAQHTCSQPPSLKLFTVVQPGTPDNPVPLLEWLRAANECMGGDALIRRQLCVFWSGFGEKNDTPNVWRSATIRRIDQATGSCEIKYHDDRRKRSQAFLYLPLTIVHFARCPPPPGGAPRSVAEGQMPIPPALPLLPSVPELLPDPQPQSSATSVATPPSLPPPLAVPSAPGYLAQYNMTTASSFPMPSMSPSAPAVGMTAHSRCLAAPAALSPTAAMAAARTLQIAARDQQAPSREAMAYDLPGSVARSTPQLGVCAPLPSSWPLGPPLHKLSELTQMLPSKSRAVSSGMFGQGTVAVTNGMSPGTPNGPEAPAKRPWTDATAEVKAPMRWSYAYGMVGVDAGLHAESGRPPTKLFRSESDDTACCHFRTGAAAATAAPAEPAVAPVNAEVASHSTFRLQSGAFDGSGAGTTASAFRPQFDLGFRNSGNCNGDAPGAGMTTFPSNAAPVYHDRRSSPSLPQPWTPNDTSTLLPRFDTAPSVSSSSSTSTRLALAQHPPMAPLNQFSGPSTGLITARSTEPAMPPQKLATSPSDPQRQQQQQQQQQQPSSIETCYPMPSADADSVLAPADFVTASVTSNIGVTAGVPDPTASVCAEYQNVGAALFGCGQRPGLASIGPPPMPHGWGGEEAFMVRAGSDKNNGGNVMNGIFASGGSRRSSSSNSRSVMTTSVVGDVNDRGYDLDRGQASAGNLHRPAAPDGILSYPVAATGKASGTIMSPPVGAAVTTDAAIMPSPLSPTNPVAAKSTVPASPAAKDNDADLDVFLAASFDFFADSEQLDHRCSGQWPPVVSSFGVGIGSSSPAAPFPGAPPQSAAVQAMQGPSFGIGGIGAHPGGDFTSCIGASFPASGGSSVISGSGADGSSSNSEALSNTLGGMSLDHVNNLSQSTPWFGDSFEVVQDGAMIPHGLVHGIGHGPWVRGSGNGQPIPAAVGPDHSYHS